VCLKNKVKFSLQRFHLYPVNKQTKHQQQKDTNTKEMIIKQHCETEVQIVVQYTMNTTRVTSFCADYKMKEQLTFADRTAEPFHAQTAVGSHDFHTCTSI